MGWAEGGSLLRAVVVHIHDAVHRNLIRLRRQRRWAIDLEVRTRSDLRNTLGPARLRSQIHATEKAHVLARACRHRFADFFEVKTAKRGIHIGNRILIEMKHVHSRRKMPFEDIRIEFLYPQISIPQPKYSMYRLQRSRNLARANGQDSTVKPARKLNDFQKGFFSCALIADCSTQRDVAPRQRRIFQNLRDLARDDETLVAAIQFGTGKISDVEMRSQARLSSGNDNGVENCAIAIRREFNAGVMLDRTHTAGCDAALAVAECSSIFVRCAFQCN